jgi:hypothetical protein
VFAVVDFEGCVDSQREGVVTLYPSDVVLELSDGSEANATRAVQEPSLTEDTPVPSGECVRGNIAFEVPEGETPAAVVYSGVARAEVSEVYGGVASVRWEID